MYQFNPEGYRKWMLIKHKGLPVYFGGKLLIQPSVVWWWPVNIFWLVVRSWVIPVHFWQEAKKRREHE